MRLFFTFFLLLSMATSYGQLLSPEYSRVKIDLTDTDLSAVAALGLEADHGSYVKGKHLINDFSRDEIALLDQAGLSYEIQIADVKAFYKAQNDPHSDLYHAHSHDRSGVVECTTTSSDSYELVTPENYEFGPMGGYITYAQLLTTLDEMATLYPDLISVKAPTGPITTHEGRPIYWLRISDNASTQEEEPEVLYTAVHHAREANSLSQLVFYMWYLLENYDTDAEIQYLVDNTQMYFIPCVNPDGYIYNETTDPDGGGLWRKNKYEEDDILYGVDLNRNYGYEWGYNDSGSSPNPDSQVFRGPSAFSEPETQAVRDFSNEHAFKIALNHHTYGNLLVYPWGYNDQVTAENETFSTFGQVLTGSNNYLVGTATETVGYTVNGSSDDWMYGENVTKPAIYSMTPETGPAFYGFWPPESEIDQLNKSTVRMNLNTAHLVLNYAEATEVLPEPTVSGTGGSLDFDVNKYGLEDGTQTLTITGLEGVNSVTPTGANSWSMIHLQNESASFDFVLSEDLLHGDEVRFLVSLDNGLYSATDTLSKTFVTGALDPIFTDSGANIDAWTVENTWGISSEVYYSAPSGFADSPGADYESNENSSMTLAEPIDLSNAAHAELSFYAKWFIEVGYDFVQVKASVDGVNFTSLCGLYTTPGTVNQAYNEPLYDDWNGEWVHEMMDLGDFIGEEEVWIQFTLISDSGAEGEGFYFDDFEVSIVPNEPSGIGELDTPLAELRVYPNPVDESMQLDFDLRTTSEELRVRIVDALGKIVLAQRGPSADQGSQRMTIDTRDLQQGVYFVELISNETVLAKERFVKVGR